MASYKRFAHVYDHFMADTPYAKWAAYIDRVIKKYVRMPDSASPIVLDLACGTGGMTLPMARKGYDMIGVDRSADMLSEAQNKAIKKKLRILFLAQDMRALDLYGTVDAVFCACDGLNYLLTEAELSNVFEGVARFLNPGGVFIFDMNTEYKFKEVLADRTFTEVAGDASYLWKNDYDQKTSINQYALHLFIRSEKREEHFEEIHHQRAYPVEVVQTLLTRAGFDMVQVNEAYTDDPITPQSERISFTTLLP